MAKWQSVPGPIQSIERAAATLRLLSGRSPRLGVAELAGELEFHKAPAGILRTLQRVGFFEQDAESGKYQLGAALLHMGSSYLGGNELRARALNRSDALATQSGESVRIGTLHANQVPVVHHVFRPDDSRQALEVGDFLPIHATGLGKGAAHPPPVPGVGAGPRRAAAFTGSTLTDPYALRSELQGVRERGWSSDVEERMARHREPEGELAQGRRRLPSMDPVVRERDYRKWRKVVQHHRLGR